jgi:conserved domain protein
MYKIIASLYRFNMRGANRSIPYFATLTNLLALFILCFFIIIALLNMQSVLKFWHTGSKSGDYLIGAVIVVPLYLLMFRMFPERKMKEQEALLTKKEYQLGLFSYAFLVIILMITLFVISK